MNFSPFGSQNYDFYSKMVEFMLSYLKHIIFACGLKSHQLIRQKFGGGVLDGDHMKCLNHSSRQEGGSREAEAESLFAP